MALSPRAQAVWDRSVKVRQLQLQPADAELVAACCTLVARLEDARERIDKDGAIVADERGRPVKHPALEIERASAAELAKMHSIVRIIIR